MKKLILLALGIGALAATSSKAQANECEGRYSINANNHLGELVIEEQRGDRFQGSLQLDNGPIEWVQGSCSIHSGTINFYRAKVDQNYEGRIIYAGGWNLEFRGTFTFEGQRYYWNASSSEDRPARAICAGSFEIVANAYEGRLDLQQVDNGTRVTGSMQIENQLADRVDGECSMRDSRVGRVRFTRYLRGGRYQSYEGEVRRRGDRVEMSGRFEQNDQKGRSYLWTAR